MPTRITNAFRDVLDAARRGLPWRNVETSAEVDSFRALEERISTYMSAADVRLVRDAYRFADEAHLGQYRATGDPYITHPLAVAGLCADWKLDAQAIMAALMHDAMEDCGVTKTELIERFGAPTADLVDGLTKLDKLQFSTREEGQAENFRKMLLAMARDVRVILIKLTDRLHNMRTMEAMAPDKRARIAQETLDIYAPIAHRLGLNQIYRELQDHSFRFLRPWRYQMLAKAVVTSRAHRRDVVEQIPAEIGKAFAKKKLTVRIFGRQKTLFSIYRKMREKHLSFAHVSDIFGIRIVVDELSDCYLALGVLHQLYKPIPGRFKDYIALPKENGYQSLHTTLVGPKNIPVEFQIRTEQMHAVAEGGIAAHWLYKGKHAPSHGEDAQRLGAMWLQSLLSIQHDTSDSNEFLEHVRIDLFPDEIYVFTPMSKILALPRGATPVDFAYAIHSDVGDHCIACRINGEPAALRTELHSGDVVEVIGAPNARPNPAWLNSVRTGRARSRIRHYLKNLEQEESQELGVKMLAQALRAEGLTLPGDDAAESQAVWQKLLRWSGNATRDELLTDIGLGRKIASIVAKRLATLLTERGDRPDAVTLTFGRYSADDDLPPQGLVVIDGTEGSAVQFGTCCRPIPGDAIVGHLGRGEGLIVHTADCPVGKRLIERDSGSFMQVEWAEQPSGRFEAAISVLVESGGGPLVQIAQAVATSEADITHVLMNQERGGESSELKLMIKVRDRLHLAEVMRKLRRTASVQRVSRVKERPPSRAAQPVVEG